MSNYNYYIDSHKLHLHPQRVAQWQRGENIYPVYMEISPSGTCNHRCAFCSMDFRGYKSVFLPTALIKERLREMGALGVKSVMYAGEGEPFLHKDMVEIAQATKDAGIDISFSTNAVLLSPEKARRILPITSWIKVSFNAGTPETYALVHGAPAKDFDTALRNMAAAVEIRAKEGSRCTLGVQCLLIPETHDEMISLARRIRDLGFDYLVIKPYTRNIQSRSNRYGDISYKNRMKLAEALQAETRPDFQIIFRHATMDRWDAKENSYERCLSFPFWCYVDAECNVWACFRHLGEDRFYYGNLRDSGFAEIWNSQKRAENLAWCEKHFNPHTCHITCRMDAINNYLWRMRHPQTHDNFI
ncbi:MAG TPA: radical SAM protein [Candidatus Omnitrophota bacterium]|nr:radical SAM protein [Candidatus Omnitrophota bacterium]HRY85590.1 radical SAM protein [Candidatus Omnitrophota bacterium]